MPQQEQMSASEFQRLTQLNKISGGGNSVSNLDVVKRNKQPDKMTASEYNKLDKTPKCKHKAAIDEVLERLGVKYEKEYKFLEDRKFRFDWAVFIGENKIAIEYEGIYSEKSRHTSMSGFVGDCEKYNFAVKHGWKVLRYTSGSESELENDLKTWL